jgi:hypothetical protein
METKSPKNITISWKLGISGWKYFLPIFTWLFSDKFYHFTKLNHCKITFFDFLIRNVWFVWTLFKYKKFVLFSNDIWLISWNDYHFIDIPNRPSIFEWFLYDAQWFSQIFTDCHWLSRDFQWFIFVRAKPAGFFRNGEKANDKNWFQNFRYCARTAQASQSGPISNHLKQHQEPKDRL